MLITGCYDQKTAGTPKKPEAKMETESVQESAQEHETEQHPENEPETEIEVRSDETEESLDSTVETVEETTPEETDPEESSDFGDFTVYDESGNAITLASLVKENKVTMIDFWGTFCGPCISQMPDLGEIERAYKDKGFEIIGITVDGVDYENGEVIAEIAADAKEITRDTNVGYPIVYPDVDLMMSVQIPAVPTAFFVDERGNIMGEPVIGARSRKVWESMVRELLK